MKDVNMKTVLIKPSEHLGKQLRRIRERKGISVDMACQKSIELENEIIRTAWYEIERRPDILLRKFVFLLRCIGIENVIIDD